MPYEDIVEDPEVDGGTGLSSNSGIVDGVGLSFMIRGRLDIKTVADVPTISTNQPRTYQEMVQADTRSALDGTAAFQRVLSQEFPDQPFEAVFNQPSYDTTGPTGYIAGIVALILPNTSVGRAAELIALADGTVELLGWLDEHDADVEQVDDGIAFLTAWATIRGEHPDVTLVFVNSLRPIEYEFDFQIEGYLVGFRDETTAYLVPVAVDGVAGAAVTMPLSVYLDRAAVRDARMAAEMAADLAAYEKEYPA